MSFQVIQRVVVRMLFDPGFAQTVFDAPKATLGPLALSAEEISWFTTTDRRAWQLDPMRRSRTLYSLLEEYPVSAACVVNHDPDTRRLDTFFSSPTFHHAIQHDISLVSTFGEYLLAQDLPSLAPMVTLEAAIARGRRLTDAAAPPAGSLVLAPGHEVVSVPEGTLAQYAALLGQLGNAPQARIETMLADGFALTSLAPLSNAVEEHVLIEPSEGGPALSEIPEPLAQLLSAATTPVAKHTLRQVAMDLGAEASEADELIGELRDDGTLR